MRNSVGLLLLEYGIMLVFAPLAARVFPSSFYLVWIIVLVLIYILPINLAWTRRTVNRGAVLVIDLFLGWTFLGWVVALAMAAGGAKDSAPRPEPKGIVKWFLEN